MPRMIVCQAMKDKDEKTLPFADDALSGRVAFVTGGATGIGRTLIETMGRLGAKVFIASRKAENLEAAVSELDSLGLDADFAACDVRDYDSVDAAVAACITRFGALDILINNAAANFPCPTAELSPNGWKTVIDIDLNGTFHCCKAAYPHLKASTFGGRIVSITTSFARTGWPGAAHAGAAKAGVLSLMRALSVEWAPDGILVNSVSPGPIAGTPGVDKLYIETGREKEMTSRVALGRFGRTEDIARAIVYLCSTAGDFITGAELAVDGGRQWTFAPNT